ncbi:hypothetical protein pb186bvf_006394 [Paramecium bursaria]
MVIVFCTNAIEQQKLVKNTEFLQIAYSIIYFYLFESHLQQLTLSIKIFHSTTFNKSALSNNNQGKFYQPQQIFPNLYFQKLLCDI